MLFHAYAALGVVLAACILAVARRDARAATRLALGGTIALLALTKGISVAAYGRDPFAVMQLLCWSVFVHLPLLLGGAAALGFRTSPRLSAAGGAIAAILVGVGVDAFLVEPGALYVKRVVVESDRVTEPLRIVALADIQTDHVGAYERAALEAAMAEEPDLVLFPGDYVQVETEALYAEQGRLFHDLLVETGVGKAPLGAVAVQGNVEWPDRWQRTLYEGTGVRAIAADETLDLGPISVTALSFLSGFDTQIDVGRPEGGDLHVVLAHGPDFALGDVDADVMIAGHTHGGQVQLPGLGPLITYSAVPRDWADDTTVFPDGRTLIVSRGIGMERRWAPRLRFFCRPQIVVVDVVPVGTERDLATR